MTIECVGRTEFDAAQVVRDHPPQFGLDRKLIVVERITAPIEGTLRVSRWRGSLPSTAAAIGDPQVELIEAHFAYPPDEPGIVRWHLNFAHSELFVAYGSSLLAQDELQVLEHPVLGALREALVARQNHQEALMPRTREHQVPTPILVRGAVRSLALDTRRGMYGNGFAYADPERILAATTYLDPPTVSNIVAMEAPPGGWGPYDRDTIEDILLTAYVGFAACKAESEPARTEIHTGGWGTGAYGGDPTLMALLQLTAARLAGVDHFAFHTLSVTDAFRNAQSLVDELHLGGDVPIDTILAAVVDYGFVWGVSDGT